MRLWSLPNITRCARDRDGDHVTCHVAVPLLGGRDLPDTLVQAFPAPDHGLPDWLASLQLDRTSQDLPRAAPYERATLRDLGSLVGDPSATALLVGDRRVPNQSQTQPSVTIRRDVRLRQVRTRLRSATTVGLYDAGRKSTLERQVTGTVRLSFAHGALFQPDPSRGPGYHLPYGWHQDAARPWNVTLHLLQLVTL